MHQTSSWLLFNALEAPEVILWVIFMLIHYWDIYISAIKHVYNHLNLADIQNPPSQPCSAWIDVLDTPSLPRHLGFTHSMLPTALTHPHLPLLFLFEDKEDPIFNIGALFKAII